MKLSFHNKGAVRFCFGTFLGVLIVAACSQENLQPLQKLYLATLSYTKIDATFCTAPPTVSKQKVKYLIVLDKSASNQPGVGSFSGDVYNTDSNGSRRYGPLVQFIQNLPADPNMLTSFDLINFNDNAYLPGSANYVQGFDPSPSNFISVVDSEWIGSGSSSAPQPVDRGFTNYVSALQMALQIIRTDAQLEAGSIASPIVTSAYRIIFVSDGTPTIADVSAPTGTYTQQFTTDILPQINQLLSLKNDPVLGPFISDIVINTAYYFQTTELPAAEALLQQMANAGNGQYLAFGAGENVLYGAFAPPVRQIRNQLDDIYVENENATWWDDGRFLLDTDGDGLPDEIEGGSGSDLTRTDSDGNGVSDLVEYRLNGRPCQGNGCDPSQRNPYSICLGLKPVVDGNGNYTYPDTDGDGLNDCEEFVLKSDRTKFDSNLNFIPDFVEFKAGMPFIAGVDESYVQPMGDGLSNYAKVKQGLPIQVPFNKVVNFRPRVSSLIKLPQAPGDVSDCYEYKVNPVAILGMNNVLRVYLIENESIIDNKPTAHVSVKTVAAGTDTVVFSPGDFQ